LNARQGFYLKFGTLMFEVVLNSHMKKHWPGLRHIRSLRTTPYRVKPRPVSPDRHMRSALLWDITQCRLVIPYWLFRTTWHYHFQGSRNSSEKHILKIGSVHVFRKRSTKPDELLRMSYFQPLGTPQTVICQDMYLRTDLVQG